MRSSRVATIFECSVLGNCEECATVIVQLPVAAVNILYVVDVYW